MKPLNVRQALVCETAKQGRCKCRCRGALHGASRSKLSEFFELLPTTDPHRTPEKSRQLPLPAPFGGPQ